MTGDIDAAGDLATGALAARAIEPRAGGSDHDAAGALCLNCGTRLIGEHCHRCGQSGHVHRTVGAIGHDIAHGVFHFEGKAWRTLPMLVARPGELTRRYIDGERARFVSPMALFLFSVFLMFTVVANLPGWRFGDSALWKPGAAAGLAEARTKIAEASATAKVELEATNARLANERAGASPDARRIARLEARIARFTKQRADAARAEQLLPPATTFDVEGTPPPAADNWLGQKWAYARENPKLVIYKLKTSAYKFSWALIPLSLPFVWLLFPFSRRFGAYDHAVFTTYSLTFMSLLTITLALLGGVGVPQEWLFVAATLIPPLHIYKQLKGTYRLTRSRALARATLLVGAIVFLILPLFAIGMLYLGVAD